MSITKNSSAGIIYKNKIKKIVLKESMTLLIIGDIPIIYFFSKKWKEVNKKYKFIIE